MGDGKAGGVRSGLDPVDFPTFIQQGNAALEQIDVLVIGVALTEQDLAARRLDELQIFDQFLEQEILNDVRVFSGGHKAGFVCAAGGGLR